MAKKKAVRRENGRGTAGHSVLVLDKELQFAETQERFILHSARSYIIMNLP